MAIAVESRQDGRVLVVRIAGKVQAADYTHFVPAIEEAVRKHGKVDILVEMLDFHGWTAGAFWQDAKFDAKHFNDINRLAIVGDQKWEQWMATFCRPFTTATIKYFPVEELPEAKAWLGVTDTPPDESHPKHIHPHP